MQLLLACGFSYAGGFAEEHQRLQLLPTDESRSKLLAILELLRREAIKLGADEKHLLNSPVHKLENRRGGGNAHRRAEITKMPRIAEFDPYSAHLYSTQAASVGAVAEGVSLDGQAYVSNIDSQLHIISERADRLEGELRALPLDRMIYAMRPEDVERSENDEDSAVVSRDGALLIQRAKKVEEDRKVREEGGFTTKAMRK